MYHNSSESNRMNVVVAAIIRRTNSHSIYLDNYSPSSSAYGSACVSPIATYVGLLFTRSRGVRVREVHGLHGRALGCEHGGRALGPFDGRVGVKIRGEGGELGGGHTSSAEADEDGLGRTVGLEAGLTAEVRGGGRGRGGGGGFGGDGVLDEGGEGGLRDAGCEDGEVAWCKGGLGELGDVCCGDGGVGCGEEGRAEAVAECEGVCELEGMCGGVTVEGVHLALDGGQD
ncbi:hypothetical protein K438DRAFT_388018 [Mycena galopus ATCC 62051]|nr:hypothetical protein K438DRAFT_388018 [Mycena galopus ATCC 62051]